MTALTIKADVSSGVAIDHAAFEAAHMATTLRVTVEFVFNDIRVYAQPDESRADVVDRYLKFRAARQALPTEIATGERCSYIFKEIMDGQQCELKKGHAGDHARCWYRSNKDCER